MGYRCLQWRFVNHAYSGSMVLWFDLNSVVSGLLDKEMDVCSANNLVWVLKIRMSMVFEA